MSTASPRPLTTRLQRPRYADLVFAVLLVWGTGDLLSTFAAFHYTGVWAEANPLIRTLLAHEPLLVIALKAGVMLLVGIVLLECQSVIERVPKWRLWLVTMVAVGAGVVSINLYVAYAAAPL